MVLYAGPSLFILYTVLSQSICFVIGHALYNYVTVCCFSYDLINFGDLVKE